ncbi:MAG: type II secretion system secretin GspD [Xanthomonadales bacterium]|nr:type II secretion system secretin GspD [Xanthomonadales bacterium]
MGATEATAPSRRWRKAALALAVAGVVAGCGTVQRPVEDPHPRLAQDETDGVYDDRVLGTDGADVEAEPGVEDTEFYEGEGSFINEAAARPRAPALSEDGEIVLNFEGESIQSVVHTILGEVLGETFVIGPGVSGQVTFATARPVTQEQLMPILELLLRWNGATLVFHEGRYHVLPIDQAIPGHLVPELGGVDQVRGFAVRAVPLEHISPTEMAKILEPYVRPNAIVNVDVMRNMIFLAGTREELRNYLRTVEIFDVDWLAGMSVGIYPLQTVDVESITAELTAVFGTEAESPLAGLFRFVPLERLGSVMVITPREDYLFKAQEWIEILDRGAAGSGMQLYVYRVKNLEAQVLADYLTQLFGGTTSGGSRDRRSNLAPGLEPVTMSNLSNFNENRASANRQGLQNNESGRGGNGQTVQGGLLGEDADIRITSVVETNSLLIQATQSQYGSILAAIERIDEEPLQVLIESQVMDVELNESLQYGVNWFLSNYQDPGFVGGPAGDSGRVFDEGTFGSGGAGFQLSDFLFGDQTFVRATISALDSVTDLRSLAAPSLIVRNNESATITVGTQVPVESTSFVPGAGGGNAISSAQYVSTGVTLDVTPRINPGGLVYLDISQEVSRPGVRDPDVSTSGNPPINNRSVTSQVAVQSGQTVFLGGLIQESDSAGTTGVPYLNRIPGLGALFGSKTRDKFRNETIVMITPTVLENNADLRAVTDDLEDEFIQVRPLKISTLLSNDDEEDDGEP